MSAPTQQVLLDRLSLYDPKRVLNHPDFKIIPKGEKPLPDANIALCYNEKKEINLVQKPRFDPAPGQVEVHVKSTGICGSDVHFWKHSKIGDSMVVRDCCGAGHESAGIVTRVGEGVTQWKEGDRVAIECGIPCSECTFCRMGKYNACESVVFFSTPPYHGTMTRYHLHPAQFLHRLPDNVTFEEGALIEPLTVAMAAIQRSGLSLSDPLLICGAGPIGLVNMLAAHAAGATPIVITDLSEHRLNVAKEILPSVKTVLIKKEDTPQQVAKRVKDAASTPIFLALECTGVESSVHSAIYSMHFGGKVFIIGAGKDIQSFPFMHMSAMEIDIQYQYRYANMYPRSVRAVEGGLVNLKSLATHFYKLEDGIEGFMTASDPSTGAIKVQIID
ncbi:L-arabinitol 4-dehydrogenase [Wallemia mellicola]|uniref:L-arabinitol 4-dehydrogenase n=1 Tax=Wallemia mellicola TaxID=1708541 RepID=A0AB38MP06_9BASI|nr:L-arabinitol 4-dehydrogenase [Wallemia mellicola]